MNQHVVDIVLLKIIRKVKQSMIKVNFHELKTITNDKLLFAVIMTKFNGQWVYVKHKDRDTWEIPVGHRTNRGDFILKKKIIALITIVGLLFFLSACGSTDTPNDSTDSSDNSADAAEPADLTGEWKQVDSNSEDSWQAATIQGDTITIYWITDGGDTESLYWAGTYVAPTTSDEPYTWDSENDHSQTDSSLLASTDDTKTITYENGQISYSASAMGTTTTVHLEKQE